MKKVALLVLVFSSLIGLSQVNLSSGLEACYRLGVNANDPINGLNGILGNVTPDVDRFNNPGQSYYFNNFNPGSIITLPDNPRLKGQAMTISTWVYPTGGQDSYFVFAKNNFNNVFFEAYSIGMNPTHFTVSKHNNTGNVVLVSTNPISFNTWYHLTLTVDQSNISLYINGVLNVTAPAPGPIDYETGKNVFLGGSNENYFPGAFNGRIDNTRFYSRILNPAEISSLHLTDPPCQNLVAPSFAYCNGNLDIWTEGFWTTDFNQGFQYYQAVVQEVDNTNNPVGPVMTYTYVYGQGGGGGPYLGSLVGLLPDKKYKIYYQVKNVLSDPWSAPGPSCTYNTVNKRTFKYCGNTNLNINSTGTQASDFNASYNYYRFEFSLNNTFSEHTVIGSPLSNKFSMELNPLNKAPSICPPVDQVNGIQYSKIYYARVKVKMNLGDPWSTPGPSCTFTTYCPGVVPIIPRSYYQFESVQHHTVCTMLASPLTCDPWHGGADRYEDAMNPNKILRDGQGGGISYGSPAQVGNALNEIVQGTGWCTGGNIRNSNLFPAGTDQSLTNAFSVEFLIKPDVSKGSSWQLRLLLPNLLNTSNYINVNEGVFNFSIKDASTAANYQINKMFIPNFPGIYSNDYFNDGNWHHLVFVYDGPNKKMQIWIDAKLLPGMELILPNGNTITKFPDTFVANDTRAMSGQWDELAMYDKALSPQLIYQHYRDMQNGNHYNYCTNYTLLNMPPVPATVCMMLDVSEFSPASIDVDKQLFSFPLPRYMPGHNLKPNFPWANIQFLSTTPATWPVTSVPTLTNLNQERATKWNYYLEMTNVNNNISGYGMSLGQLGYEWIKQAQNLNNFPISSVLFEHYKTSIPLPLQTLNEATTATLNGMFETRGKVVGSMVNNNLVQHIQRKLDIINMDEESFHPEWLASANTAGPLSQKAESDFQKGVFDPVSYGTNYGFVNSTKFSKYRVGQYDDGLFFWTKDITAWKYPALDVYTSPTHWDDGNPASHGLKTFEISRSWELGTSGAPQLCSPFVSANWSLDENSNMKPSQYLAALKGYAMLGAEFYYVSYFNETRQMCLGVPPTCTAVTQAWPNAPGLQYYNNQPFVTGPGQPNDPRKYFYQIAMPSYAQAITSRYEDILRSSYLLNGLNSIALYSTNYKYRFTAGNEVVYARQYCKTVGNNCTPQQLYVVTGSIMLNNNCAGFEPEEKNQTIKFPGWTSALYDLTFKIRRQGSTYIYDRRDLTNIIFFQLDKWHEVTHPWNWSKDFKFEAELNDDKPYTSNNNKVKLKTEKPIGAAATDYSDFTTFIRYPNGSDKKTTYHFAPRDQNNSTLPVTYYVWVRARRNSDNTTPVGKSSLDIRIKRENNTNPNTLSPPFNTNVLSKTTVPCIDNSGWKWYSFGYQGNISNPTQAITFIGTATHEHEIEITGNDSYVEFDQFVISTSPGTPAGVPASEVAVYCGSNNRPAKNLEETPDIPEEELNNSAINLYPSPTTGEFFVNTENYREAIQEVRVINILGQEVYHEKDINRNRHVITLSNSEYSGVFFVEIISDGKTYKKKVVIVK